MSFEIILLTILSFSIILGVPLYIYFRNKSINRKSQAKHTRKRVFKLTGINFLLNFYSATIVIGLYLSIILRDYSFNNTFMFLSLIFVTSMFATFYGNGIYLTSTVLEYYTLPQIKKLKEFNTQFIATHLFHGPISHILVYSGWIVVFLSLALLDLVQPLYSGTKMFSLLLFLGGLTGIIYATGQIYNRTAPFQFITGIFTAVVLTVVFGLTKLDFYFSPIALYFSSLILTFNSTLLIHFVLQKNSWRKNKLGLS